MSLMTHSWANQFIPFSKRAGYSMWGEGCLQRRKAERPGDEIGRHLVLPCDEVLDSRRVVLQGARQKPIIHRIPAPEWIQCLSFGNSSRWNRRTVGEGELTVWLLLGPRPRRRLTLRQRRRGAWKGRAGSGGVVPGGQWGAERRRKGREGRGKWGESGGAIAARRRRPPASPSACLAGGGGGEPGFGSAGFGLFGLLAGQDKISSLVR